MKELEELFQWALDAEAENREVYLDDIRFSRLSEQWPEDIKRKRQEEGRPTLTINRLTPFLRQVVNDIRRSDPSVRVRPVDSKSDPQVAAILRGIIRHVWYASSAEGAIDIAVENAVSGGVGYLAIDIDYTRDDSFDLDLKIIPIVDSMAIVADPTSTRFDSEDWSFAFEVLPMTEAEFAKRYPDAEPASWAPADGVVTIDAMDGENTVTVAVHWERSEVPDTLLLLSDGTVTTESRYMEDIQRYMMAGVQVIRHRPTVSYRVVRRVLAGEGVLEEDVWPGRYIPIVPVYGDLFWVNGRRYYRSLIHQAKDPQRMHNYWRSTSTELVALAPKSPFVGPVGAFTTDAQKWATINTDSHAYVEYDGPVRPTREPFPGPPAAAIQEALMAADDIKSVVGMFDASLGARSNETSGVAIMARQREGDAATFHFGDNLKKSVASLGRILVDLIPHVYSDDRIVRIVGDDPRQVQQVRVNAPNPSNPFQKIHDLTVGKYDVTCDLGPTTASQREDSMRALVEMVRTFPNMMPAVADIIMRHMDIPEASEIAGRLQAMSGGDPRKLRQQLAKLQQYAQRAGRQIQQLQAENQRLKLQLQQRAQETQVDVYEAQTDRMEAETDRMKAMMEAAQVVNPSPMRPQL